jgi:short-subunit dehydrogenase
MNYLIVGASSGLGRDLAYIFAKNSHNLTLISRDKRDTQALKTDIENKFNSKVNIDVVDCSSSQKVNTYIESNLINLKNMDGILFPIGMIFEDDTIQNDISRTNDLIQANYGVVAHFVSVMAKIFKEKNSGSIVGFGSVSAYLGRDLNTTYAASKRALNSFFESLALSNIKTNTNVQFYILGYLESNMTFGRKLFLPKGSTKKLAKIVYKNINKKYKKVYFPYWWAPISYILIILPFFIIRNLIKVIK